jgi:hypothetical protein
LEPVDEAPNPNRIVIDANMLMAMLLREMEEQDNALVGELRRRAQANE